MRLNEIRDPGPDYGKGPPDSCPGPQHLDVVGVIGKMALVYSDFHTRKNLSENRPQFWHMSSKIFTSPILGRKV